MEYLKIEYKYFDNNFVDYREQLTIKKSGIAIHKKIFFDAKVTSIYKSPMSISYLLEDFEYMFVDFEVPNNQDFTNINDIISISYKENENAEEKNFEVPYNRCYLPEDWDIFIERLEDIFISLDDKNQILNSRLYGRGVRENEYIYVRVAFGDYYDDEEGYYYKTTCDTYKIGDEVVVPTGKNNNECVGTIVGIEYFTKENVPYPLEKTKEIIRKI